MHEHDVPSDSVVAKWAMRIAIVVFAGLGILELAVATFSHKVVLGVDGAHNLVDALLYIVNLRAAKWANSKDYNFRSCVAEPGSTLLTSGAVVLSAAIFTLYETLIAGGTESHQLLALGLLVVSFLANATYATVILLVKRRRPGNTNRQLRNVIAHAVGDASSTLLSVVAYILIIVWLGNAFDPIFAWAGVALITWVHREEIPDGWRLLMAHRVPLHPHPVILPDHHGSDHSH